MEASTALARFRSLELSPARFLQLALANTFGLWLIVGSGAAVRLTDSGLGCRHWPGCERGQPLPARDVHAFVEFGNRLVGGVVITLTLVTWLAARRTPGLPGWARRVALLVFLGALCAGAAGLPGRRERPALAGRDGPSPALDRAARRSRRRRRRGARACATAALLQSFPASCGFSPSSSRRPASCSSSAAPSRPRRDRTRAAASTSTASGSSNGACTSTAPSSVSSCSRSCSRSATSPPTVTAHRLSSSSALGVLGAAARADGDRGASVAHEAPVGARSRRTSCSRPPSGQAPLPWRHCSSGRLGRCSPAST